MPRDCSPEAPKDAYAHYQVLKYPQHGLGGDAIKEARVSRVAGLVGRDGQAYDWMGRLSVWDMFNRSKPCLAEAE